MTEPRSGALARWWPTTQSLDLVKAPVEAVASALTAEMSRTLPGVKMSEAWQLFPDLDHAFAAAPSFYNVPTFYLALPTRSEWTVLWNNSFLCDGYDSLCHNLTRLYHFTTVHWFAHDAWTTMQSGAGFCHRRWDGAAMVERVVQAGQEDKRWTFSEYGEPLPEEDLATYQVRRKRDRLNEKLMMELLTRLGAEPWSPSFYALPERLTFVLQRMTSPDKEYRRTREQVIPDLVLPSGAKDPSS